GAVVLDDLRARVARTVGGCVDDDGMAPRRGRVGCRGRRQPVDDRGDRGSGARRVVIAWRDRVDDRRCHMRTPRVRRNTVWMGAGVRTTPFALSRASTPTQMPAIIHRIEACPATQ